MIDREAYIRDVVPRLRMRPVAADLADFLGVDRREVESRARCDAHDDALRAEWLAEPPELSEAAVRRFYAASRDGYVFAHALADRYAYDKYRSVKPYFTGTKILDYGAGNGTLAMIIGRLESCRVFAADIDGPQARFAAWRYKKYGLPIEPIVISESGYPAGTWDTILCLDVLEHVVDWRGAVEWMAKSLPPGGRLILIVSFELYPGGALHVTDRTGLTPDELRGHAVTAGMRAIAVDGELFVFEKIGSGQ